MIRLTKENTQKAIAKCKQLKPKVKFLKDRLFVVYSANNSNVYYVRFDVQNGEKFGECECKASEKIRLNLFPSSLAQLFSSHTSAHR